MERELEHKIKPCVVLFAEVIGLDELAKKLDIEDYAELRQKIKSVFEQIIESYDGHVDKHEHTGVMVTFGVPKTHEDDPERAVRTALSLKTALSDINQEHNCHLQFKAGIHLGRVFAGEIGSELKAEYTVLGEPVNLAARIREWAREGQVLVSEEIYEYIKPVFESSEPFTISPQGYEGEVKVYEVLGIKTGFIKRRGIEGLYSPFVGRDEELNILKELLEELFNDKGNILFILGEAGVGKSRLVEEFFTFSIKNSLTQAEKLRWIYSRCSPYKESIFYPILEIVKQACNITGDESEEDALEKLFKKLNDIAENDKDNLLPYIANVMKIPLPEVYSEKIKYLRPEELKLQTMVSLSHFLNALAEKERVIYCIDDLFLADKPTIDTLKFLFETHPQQPSLFIFISRPVKNSHFWPLKEKLVAEGRAKELFLQTLDYDTSLEILANLLRISNIPETLLYQIATEAEGNPFYLEEIIKLLISRGLLVREGSEWTAKEYFVDLEIPYTIESIIEARYDSLTPEQQYVLKEALVIDRSFSKKIISLFTRYWDSLDTILDDLVEIGYLTAQDNENYYFYHSLIRETIYNNLTEREKKDLHQRVADALETMYKERLEQVSELLFEHYKSAGNVQKSIQYAIMAGDYNEKNYANYEALSYYDYVLMNLSESESEEDIKLRAKTIAKVGKILCRIGKCEEAISQYRLALEFVRDDENRPKFYELIADAYQMMSNYSKALFYLDKASELMQNSSEEDKIDLELELAWIKYLTGDYLEAKEITLRAIQRIKNQSSIRSKELLSRIYNQLGTIYSHLGDIDASFEAYNKALKICEILEDEKGKGVILNNISGYFSSKGDYYNAIKYLERSLEIDLKTGSMLSRAICTYNIGENLLELGEFEKADEKFDEYLSINARINNILGNGYGNWGKGRIFLQTGDYEKAELYLKKAYEIFNSLGARSLKLGVALTLSELEIERGNFEKANEKIKELKTQLEEIEEKAGVIECYLALIWSRLKQGLLESNIELFKEAHLMLNELQDMIKDQKIDIEKLFAFHFYRTLASYKLNEQEEFEKHLKECENIINTLLGNIPEEENKKKFLSKRIYKYFNEFKNSLTGGENYKKDKTADIENKGS